MDCLTPAFNKGNIAMAITSSEEYTPFLGVLLESIVENSTSNHNYDIVVLTTDISEISKKRLEEIVYRDNFSLRYLDVSSYMSQYSLHTNFHITPMTYCRLALLDLLSQYDKVIYSDADVIFNKDISELWEVDFSNNGDEECLVAGVIDSVLAGFHNLQHKSVDELLDVRRRESVAYNVKYLNAENEADVINYFNAGIILMNLKAFRKEYTSQELFELAASQNWRWFDQDILNKICHGRVKFLDASWNYMCHDMERDGHSIEKMATSEFYKDYLKARIAPKALHYCGKSMPCYAPKVDNGRYFWKYARKTLYYEDLLCIMMENRQEAPEPGWENVDKDIYARFRFPWKAVKPGARIVVYGGGVVGKIFLRQLSNNPYCHVVAVCDKNPDSTGIRECPVIDTVDLAGMDREKYDCILIAIEREDVAEDIKKTLVLSGIMSEKILWLNPAK